MLSEEMESASTGRTGRDGDGSEEAEDSGSHEPSENVVSIEETNESGLVDAVEIDSVEL